MATTKLHPPGLFPFGLVTGTPLLPSPRPLVGFTGLVASVGTYLRGGAVATGAAGFTAGFGGMNLVPAPESDVGT